MIEKSYGRKGGKVVAENFAAVDQTLAGLHEVAIPKEATSVYQRPPIVSLSAPDFVQKFTAEIMAGRGDDLPVSAMPSTARFRPARPPGKNAISPMTSRSGKPTCASSAANAPSLARIPSFAPAFMIPPA